MIERTVREEEKAGRELICGTESSVVEVHCCNPIGPYVIEHTISSYNNNNGIID